MNVALRGLTVLVGGTALATALATQALATPASSAGHVKTVYSCSQNVGVRHYTCFAERRSDLGFTTKKQVEATPQAAPSGFGPSSLQSAYKLPRFGRGSGQRVYIVDAYDDPNAESDLAAYRTQFGLPSCTTANGCFQKLNQNGTTSPLPKGDTGWAGEISLDLDMVSAICPNCAITLVEATDASDNLFTAVKTATNLGAKFVSMSWGGSEGGTEPSYDSQYFQSSGVVYTASTGDDGYSAGVIYPATSPRVVAVGGTSLKTSTNSRGCTESVWNGAGSGCSTSEAKPSFQSSISACSKRADRRRLRRCRPGHRRRRLPDLRRQWLGRLRRHERFGADHRLGLRARRHTVVEHHRPVDPVRAHRQPVRRHDRQQRQLLPVRAVHRHDRMGRAHRPGYAERHRRLRWHRGAAATP